MVAKRQTSLRRPKAAAQRTQRLSPEQQQAVRTVQRTAAQAPAPAPKPAAPTAPVTPTTVAAPAAPLPVAPAPTTVTSPGMQIPDQVARDFGRYSLPPDVAVAAPAPAVMPQQTIGALRPGQGGAGINPALLVPDVPAPQAAPAMQPDFIGLPPRMSPQEEALQREMHNRREADMRRAQEEAVLAADRQRQQQAQMDLVNRMQPPPPAPAPAPAMQPPPFRPGEGGRGVNPDLLAQISQSSVSPQALVPEPTPNQKYKTPYRPGEGGRGLPPPPPPETIAESYPPGAEPYQPIPRSQQQVPERQLSPADFMGFIERLRAGQQTPPGIPMPPRPGFVTAPYTDPAAVGAPPVPAPAPAPSGIAALAPGKGGKGINPELQQAPLPTAPTQQQMQTGMAPGKGGMGINPALQQEAAGPFGGQAALPTAPANPTPAPQSAPPQPMAPAPRPGMSFGRSMFGAESMFKAGGLTTKIGPKVQAAARADIAKAKQSNTQKGVGLAKKGLGKFKVR